MKTNEIYVSNQGVGREEALNETEKYADYQGLDRKARMHIRILAEEMLGMVETIAGNFYAYYWIEGDSEGYQLHLEAKVEMNTAKRDALIDASTSKQNNSAKGVMGKLRDVFQYFRMGYKEAMNDPIYMNNFDNMGYGLVSFDVRARSNMWSLSQYQISVKENNDNLEDWDELEKSIIANIADDVTVGIKGDNVEMVITKRW